MKRLRLPSPSMIVAMAALLVALGGAGYAATQRVDPTGRSAVSRVFGPVKVAGDDRAVVGRAGGFVFSGTCMDEGDYAGGHLAIKASVGHSAFKSSFSSENRPFAGEADMVQGQRYEVFSAQSEPGLPGVEAVTGIATAPNGATVSFHFYLATYALGAVRKPCVYGGTTTLARSLP